MNVYITLFCQKKTPMKQILITMLEQNSGNGRVRRLKEEEEEKKYI
jgi:hypothetical protein